MCRQEADISACMQLRIALTTHPLTSAYTHPHLLLRPLTRYLSYARAAADHELVEHVKEKARAWVESAAAQE